MIYKGKRGRLGFCRIRFPSPETIHPVARDPASSVADPGRQAVSGLMSRVQVSIVDARIVLEACGPSAELT